jgi:hypothetical protein
MANIKNGQIDPKENLVVIKVMVGSMVVPPTSIKRYATIQRRVFNQFQRHLNIRKEVSENVYRVDCTDCD